MYRQISEEELKEIVHTCEELEQELLELKERVTSYALTKLSKFIPNVAILDGVEPEDLLKVLHHGADNRIFMKDFKKDS